MRSRSNFKAEEIINASHSVNENEEKCVYVKKPLSENPP